MRRRTFSETTRELADRATERARAFWFVHLDEPTTTLYAKRDGHADANLMAVLYADRMPARIAETDRDGVMCVRTETPICVLACAEEFMRTLMATLRANGCHGHYRKAGTRREYKF